jgi:DNA-binding MarR family transcriptional regulator
VSAFSQVMQEFRRRLPPDAQEIGRGAILFKLSHHGPARPSDLAGWCHLDLSTVSRHLGALERDGQVERLADPDDGRAHRVAVTSAGQEYVADFITARSAMVAAATATWTPTERADLERLLRRLAEDLAALRSAEGEDK